MYKFGSFKQWNEQNILPNILFSQSIQISNTKKVMTPDAMGSSDAMIILSVMSFPGHKHNYFGIL